ncbi:MAG TPA: type II toxin-antitoxin system VapC family toxin [Gemmataceae bacterium]|nr:type II toxin-antitoxin system VapC family toxin [Gemmataceae bacterium]
MSKVVLDSSAFLAVANREPGADRVQPVLRQAFLSAVSLTEVLQKLVHKGMTLSNAEKYVREFIGSVVAFDHTHAAIAAEMAALTRQFGLSLADRSCLALARSMGAVVMTADQNWVKLDLGVQIELIRGLTS